MQVIFQEVSIENVVKNPKTRYSVATVTYTVNGNNRQYKMFSFANPDVFAAVQKFNQGDTLDVTITKNDKGYDQWAKVTKVDAEAAPAAAGARAPAFRDERETREERVERQLHIVRQSSLSNAVNTLVAGAKAPPKVEDVLALAQQYVDFVYENDSDALVTTDAEFTDVPV